MHSCSQSVVSRRELQDAILVGRQSLKVICACSGAQFECPGRKFTTLRLCVAAQDKRLSKTFSIGAHMGIDSTASLLALALMGMTKASGQENQDPGTSDAIFKGQLVEAWLLKVPTDEKQIGEEAAAQMSQSGQPGLREGPRPVYTYECCYHTWASSDLEGEEDRKAKRKQVAALQRQVFGNDTTGKVEHWFSAYNEVQTVVERYSYLTSGEKVAVCQMLCAWAGTSVHSFDCKG